MLARSAGLLALVDDVVGPGETDRNFVAVGAWTLVGGISGSDAEAVALRGLGGGFDLARRLATGPARSVCGRAAADSDVTAMCG